MWQNIAGLMFTWTPNEGPTNVNDFLLPKHTKFDNSKFEFMIYAVEQIINSTISNLSFNQSTKLVELSKNTISNKF